MRLMGGLSQSGRCLEQSTRQKKKQLHHEKRWWLINNHYEENKKQSLIWTSASLKYHFQFFNMSFCSYYLAYFSLDSPIKSTYRCNSTSNWPTLLSKSIYNNFILQHFLIKSTVSLLVYALTFYGCCHWNFLMKKKTESAILRILPDGTYRNTSIFSRSTESCKSSQRSISHHWPSADGCILLLCNMRSSTLISEGVETCNDVCSGVGFVSSSNKL